MEIIIWKFGLHFILLILLFPNVRIGSGGVILGTCIYLIMMIVQVKINLFINWTTTPKKSYCNTYSEIHKSSSKLLYCHQNTVNQIKMIIQYKIMLKQLIQINFAPITFGLDEREAHNMNSPTFTVPKIVGKFSNTVKPRYKEVGYNKTLL